MPMPPRLRDPARLPGRTPDRVLFAAQAHPRWVAIVVIILCAIVAIPTLTILALARVQGDRR